MGTIKWTQHPRSELGDRLCDIVIVATYARLAGHKLRLAWPEYSKNGLEQEFRLIDIQEGNMRRKL